MVFLPVAVRINVEKSLNVSVLGMPGFDLLETAALIEAVEPEVRCWDSLWQGKIFFAEEGF